MANRFIKNAIAQVKYGRPPGQDEGVAGPSTERVPVKVTSKMAARAQYEKELKEMSSEEEDELEVIDDAADEEEGGETGEMIKGKDKATEQSSSASTSVGHKRRRPLAMDAFEGESRLHY